MSLELALQRQQREERERAERDSLRVARGVTAVDCAVSNRREVAHAEELAEFLRRLGYDLVSWFEARVPGRRAA